MLSYQIYSCAHWYVSGFNSDVKHRNIGFDVRGDVKIFDFGLAKSMHPKLRTPNGLYRFTALTGSIPYMAPEVAASQPYNEKSDVYSFGMLFWAILSLKSPWCAFPSLKDDIGGYTRLVVNSGTRPLIKSKWPRLARHVLKSSFMKSAEARPSMSKICGMLSTDLVELAKEESIHQRTQNMMAASWNSDSVEDEEAVDIF
jgi:serine/threonine protein kinase